MAEGTVAEGTVAEGTVAEGTVAWYDNDKGRGEIRVDDGSKVHVLQQNVEQGKLQNDVRVKFNIAPGPHGRHAINVRPL